MVELTVLAALAFTAVVVCGVLASVFGLVMWLIFLPFRIIGWVLQGAALLLALPFVAFFGVIAAVVLAGGILMFLIPLLPFALLALGAWWLVRRTGRSAAAATH